MIRGEIEVTGVGIALIDDALAATLQDIVNTLETIDDVLAAAEQVLQTLDQIIALVEPYLQDSVIQALIDAQTALANAQAMANDPNVSEAEAQAALENAQTLLNNANAAYQAALLEFFEDFLDIIIATIGELYNDYQGQGSTIESEYNTAKGDVDTWLTQNNDPLPEGDGYGVPPGVIDLGSSFEDITNQIPTLSQTDPEMADYIAKSDTYFEKEMPYILKLVIDELKNEILEVEHSKELASMMKEEGLDILDTIDTMMKANEPQEDIIAAAKVDILLGLKKILLRF